MSTIDRIIRRLSWGVLLALALFRFAMVMRHAVDIPLLDEWEMIPFVAENDLDFEWRSFFRFHNDHRILSTRLEVYVAYLLDGWNIPHVLAVNYAIYIGMVGMLVVSRFDAHPNEFSHVLAAQAIEQFVRENLPPR